LYGISLFDSEVRAANKLAEGMPASFVQHDCSIVKKLGKEAPVTYSLWMLNNAKSSVMFVRMCQTMLVNTEPGGTGLFLLQVADSNFWESTTSKNFNVVGMESIQEAGKLLGVLVEKRLWLGRRSVAFRDSCYPRTSVMDWMREAGWINVRMVPTLPLSTDQFGEPKEAAKYIDRVHYNIFMAERPNTDKKVEL